MNTSDILTLYDYNYWATGRVLTAGRNASEEQFIAPTTQSFRSLRGDGTERIPNPGDTGAEFA